MNYYYITGTSRGIGKAIAEALLEDNDNKVTGISRKQTIKHKRYAHESLDLSKPGQAESFKFHDHDDAERIVLLNNAGTLGEVKHVGHLDNEMIRQAFELNITAPAILCNNFIEKYRDVEALKIVLNVTSGAGQRPIDGWSVYCSSKAQMNMFSQVIQEEQTLDQPEYPFRIFAITPSIVDTEMQTTIRKADQQHFRTLENFINYKEDNMLQQPGDVAQKFVKIMKFPEQFTDIVFSVRDVR